MQFRNTLILALAVPFGVVACDAGSFVEPGSFQTPVDISVDLAGLSVGGVAVEVTGPGIDSPIIATLPVADGVASGQVEVLAGSDRAFTVRAFDTQGLETHRGGDTLDIAADAAETLNVSLTPLTGNVDLDGRLGSYALTVSFSGDTIAAGATAQAAVTVVDAYGDTLSNPTVAWGSSNPAVASVDSTGVVQGLVSGQATIGATYRGFGGSAAIAVQ